MIDSHAHLISDDNAKYPPAPPEGEIKAADLENPMTVERLLDQMDAAGVDKAVLVQRGSIYGYDSSYVCDSADRFPERLVAVCSVDATRPDSAEQVHYWVGKRRAAGIRLMELVRCGDLAWLDSKPAREAWIAAAELGAPVCVHFFPWNRAEGLVQLAAILDAIPGVTVVVDHLAAIRTETGAPDYGVDDLLETIAGYDGTTIKFTTIPLGRLEKAGVETGAVVRRVLDLFGAERMMWGSDITQSPGSYDYMVGLGRKAVSGLTAAQQDHLLVGTAARVYGTKWV